MDRAMEAACRTELWHAGLSGQGTLAPLLALLRAAPESHVTFGQAVRIAEEHKLAISAGELARQLELLVDYGLLGRVPSVMAEPVFDTVLEPHSHLIYEETGQTVDLHVSPETLLAVVRRALAEHADRVEILVRIRGGGDDRAVADN